MNKGFIERAIKYELARSIERTQKKIYEDFKPDVDRVYTSTTLKIAGKSVHASGITGFSSVSNITSAAETTCEHINQIIKYLEDLKTEIQTGVSTLEHFRVTPAEHT